MSEVEILFVPLPSSHHRGLLDSLLPLLAPGHVVVFTPGTILSSFMAAGLARATGIGDGVTFAESATLPYGTRRTGPSRVNVNCGVTYNPLGVFPARRTEEVMPRLTELFSTFLPATDCLDAALNNQSPITQPAGMVLNTGYIENVRDFHLHRDGVTTSVLRVEEEVDAERVALRRAMGYQAPDYPMKEFYRPGSTNDRALFSNVIQEVNETGDYEEFYETYMPYEGMNHRYLTEACAEGLVFIKALANRLGVPTPNSDAIIQLASVISQRDYLATGRTPESVCLVGTSDEIRTTLFEGM
ncbi:MAG: NAD/NADP octopine/nopaline dehydrogenase family protein [Dehalococcoidia bacterium]